jgi:hypothetical protein
MDASKVAEFVKPDLMAVSSNTSVIDKNHPESGAVFTAPADYHQFMVTMPTGRHALWLRSEDWPRVPVERQWNHRRPGQFR